MKKTSIVAALAALALALPPAGNVAAQDESAAGGWSVGLWAGGGYQWPAGRLANNAASDNPELRLLETVANLNPSQVMAGGLVVHFQAWDMSVRLGGEATRGAEVVGQVAICDLVSGSICAPETAPARVRSLASTVRLLAGNPLSSVRPVIVGGLGVRTFDMDIPECPPRSTGEDALICWAVTDIYRDPQPHYFLRAGVGIEARTRLMALGVDLLGSTGRYRGGAGRTDGNWYHDLRVQASASVPLYRATPP